MKYQINLQMDIQHNYVDNIEFELENLTTDIYTDTDDEDSFYFVILIKYIII